MKKISTILAQQSHIHGFSVIGVNGYAGEQDGSRAILSGPHRFSSKEQADREFPSGVPEYVRLHWGRYIPGHGWEAVFGWWSNQPEEGDGNPLIGD